MFVSNISTFNIKNHISFTAHSKETTVTENQHFAQNPPVPCIIETIPKELPIDELYDDFISKVEKTYNKPFIDVAEEITTDSRNIIGEGSRKAVYKIPEIADYIIGVHKSIPHKKADFKRTPIRFKEYNFAQPIADNGSDLIIMKRLSGESHSLKDWKPKYVLTYQGIPCVTKEDSKIFLEQLKRVEQFPLSAYIDFAKQVKFLSENNQRMDSFNPNNLLIDSIAKKFRVIDLLDEERGSRLESAENSVFDMQCLLCDVQLHSEYRKNLSDREKDEFDKLTKRVVKKCQIAAEYTGLETNSQNAFETFKAADILFSEKNGFIKCIYENGQDFYKNYCI